jgi:hypothetical protein
MLREENNREARLRSRLQRRGFALRKSRSRTPEHHTYGLYRIVEPNANLVVSGAGYDGDYTLDLDGVEAWLEE